MTPQKTPDSGSAKSATQSSVCFCMSSFPPSSLASFLVVIKVELQVLNLEGLDDCEEKEEEIEMSGESSIVSKPMLTIVSADECANGRMEDQIVPFITMPVSDHMMTVLPVVNAHFDTY